MGQIDDVNGHDSIPSILRRLRVVELASNMNSSAVGRGGIRVHSGGGITIENGGLSVTGSAAVSGYMGVSGTAEITGLLAVSGTTRLTGQTDIWGPLIVTGETDLDGLTTINGDTSVTGRLTVAGPTEVTGTFKVTGDTDLEGLTNITGNTTVEGDFTVNGPMKTTGALDVEGITTLKNDLNVTTGAKITAGGVSIDPEYLAGSVRFDNGTYIAATPNGAQLVKSGTGGGAVTVGETQADISAGGKGVIVNSNGITLVGALPTTSEKPNLWADPETGKLHRSTAP